MSADTDEQNLGTLFNRFRPVAAWAFLCLTVAPYFTLFAARHTELNVPEGLWWLWWIELPWMLFPVCFCFALMFAKGRMRLMVMVFAFLFAPFFAEYTEPERGMVVDAPWYFTCDHTMRSLRDR